MEQITDAKASSSQEYDPSSLSSSMESATNPQPLTSPFTNETIHSPRQRGETKDSMMSAPETSMLDVSISPESEPDQSEDRNSMAVDEHSKDAELSRGLIDTAAPFESVREAVSKFGSIVDWKARKAVSKFGSIVDWKARKAVSLEKREDAEFKHKKAREQIPEYKSKLEAAEEAKAEALNDLDSTKRRTDELKLGLEKAEMQETQAKQDSELAELRFEEMKKGITSKESFAAKAQLALAKERHSKAVSDLVSVREEIESLHGECISLVSERDIAIRKAEEAIDNSIEIDKDVEDLTLELITMKELLDSAHSEHLEVEEQRINSALDWNREKNTWNNELRFAEAEMQHLSAQLSSANDLMPMLETATTFLLNLKAELASYVKRKGYKDGEKPTDDGDRMSLQVKSMSARNELEEVKAKTERSRSKVNHLRAVASALEADIERMKTAEGFRNGIALPVEYYNTICKKAREAEEIRNQRVISAIEQIEEAKKFESKVKEKLRETNMKIEGMKRTMRTALDKSEKAKEGKLALETELQQRRAESKLRRRADASLDLEREKTRPVSAGSARSNSERNDAENSTNFAKMRRRPFFPQVVLFLARKKAQSLR